MSVEVVVFAAADSVGAAYAGTASGAETAVVAAADSAKERMLRWEAADLAL